MTHSGCMERTHGDDRYAETPLRCSGEPHPQVHAGERDGSALRWVMSAALRIVAALCWWLALPPRGWWVLFSVGVAAFMGAVVGHRLRDRLWLGGLGGLAHYALALQWLSAFSTAGYLVAALLEATLLAGVAALSPGRGPHRRGPLPW